MQSAIRLLSTINANKILSYPGLSSTMTGFFKMTRRSIGAILFMNKTVLPFIFRNQSEANLTGEPLNLEPLNL